MCIRDRLFLFILLFLLYPILSIPIYGLYTTYITQINNRFAGSLISFKKSYDIERLINYSHLSTGFLLYTK